ncbi:MAG: TadE/TadG family type IV pilus assembly protein [Pseudomonadota bacterium]
MVRKLFKLENLRRFAAEQSGMASLEFAVFFPAFCVILFMMAEASVFQARAILLDRGVDTAMRDLRIGAIPDPTHEKIKNRICDNAYLIERSCLNGLRIEFITIDAQTGTFDRPQPTCRDLPAEALNPVQFSVDPGEREEITFVSVCLVIAPIFPRALMGEILKFQSPLSDDTRYALIAQSAFMNEPG